jgi:hypothetical protein
MRIRDRHTASRAGLAVAAAASAIALSAVPAQASGGGTSAGGGGGDCRAKATFIGSGKVQAPDCAPRRVKRVIRAANEIAKGKDYCLGGGHSSWKSSCYDCSGAVSYALHGGGLVDSPMPSGAYTRWGKRGKGKWITVYANSGHMYAVFAGMRFDTSMTAGKGPGWSNEMRSSSGYKVRHPGGL